ncbi:hypothetical protein C8R44DRAFT_766819 [Mycena epipterygia]|nr:hypothetical protein C8R44DRAFT_766819 [Mycena epipterygia]
MMCASCKHPLPPLDALPTPAQTEGLLSLLRSLYSPGPLDSPHHLSQMHSSTAALAQHDAAIEGLQKTLRGMLADRMKLQKYADGCRGVFAPVRRLPPEIMCEIFASLPPSSRIDDSAKQLDNLAKSDLLQISKVCAHWHRLVMGTPRLWSDIAVNASHWPEDATRFLDILRVSLERGGRYPLTLSVDMAGLNIPYSTSHPLLELVAEHSDRWRSASFKMELPALTSIQHVEGKLGMLERLSLMLLDPEDGPTDSVEEIDNITIFETAPRLRHVRFSSSDPHGCPKLPWKQLRSFTYDGEDTDNIRASMALILNLSHPEAAFEFRNFSLYQNDLPLDLPPITSRISSFLLEVETHWNPQNTVQAFGEVMGCLTLPHLRELRLARSRSSAGIILWPVSQFKSLSSRSSFRDTLRVLELPYVTITADDLIQSLASLGSLERLVISDQAALRKPAHILVTDALLLRLTSTPDSDSTLVPMLNHLTCTSFFEFTADIYFDSIASRIAPDRPPFQAVLRRHGCSSYHFDPNVTLKLMDLAETGELQFVLDDREFS